MSATVIDSLVVWLGLDPTGFRKGQKEVQDGLQKTGEAAEKTQKQIDESNKKSVESFGKIRDAVLGVAAVIVGAVASSEFVQAITKSDVAVGNLGRNVGSTTREVSILEGIFRRMGSSAAEADGFLNSTNQILQEIRMTGTSQALQPFAMFGLDIGKYRDAGSYLDRLRMLATAAAQMDPQRARYLLGRAGIDDDQINVILRGVKAIDELAASQAKLNVSTDEDVEAGKRRTQATSEWDQALEQLGRRISTYTEPIVDYFKKKLTEFVQYVSQDVPSATATIVALTAAMSAMTAASIARWVAGMVGGFGAVGKAAVGLLSKVAPVIAALWSLYEVGHLVAALVDDYQATHREGIKLTPEAAARIAAGEGAGVAIGQGAGVARGIRNNNPGNLEFAGQAGATREGGSGRFAAFGSLAEGLAAMDEQLQRYGAKGTDTIASIVSKYAPAGDNNNVPAYIADLVGKTGFAANQHLNLGDADTMRSLMLAMTGHEGNRVSVDDINAGMALAQQRSGGGGNVSVSMGDVHMHTTASTIDGHAQDLGQGVRHYVLASQSNGGVN